MAQEKNLTITVNAKTQGEDKVKSLKAQLKEMKNELMGLDEGSERFKTLSKQAAELEDHIGDVNQKVKALSSDTKNLDALVGAGSAIAGAFQTASGAMALFGSNQEQVQKAIQNVIAIQGVLNGVQQLGQFITEKGIIQSKIKAAWDDLAIEKTKAYIAVQKALNAVMSMGAFGITALIAGVGALVSALVYFSKGTDAAAKAQESLNKAITAGNEAAGAEEAKIKVLLTTINSHTASLKEKEAAIKSLNELSPEYLGNLTLENIHTDRAALAIQGYIEATRRKIELQVIEKDLSEAIAARMEFERKLQEDQTAVVHEAMLQGLEDAKAEEEALLNLLTTRQDSNKTISDEIGLRGQLGGGIGTLKKTQEVHTESVKKNTQAVKENNDEAERQRDLAEQRNEALEAIIAAENEYQDSLLDAQQREINAVQDKYFVLIEEAKKYGFDYGVLLEAQNAAIFEINQKYRDLEKQAEQEKLDAEFDALEASIDQENRVKEANAEAERQRDEQRKSEYMNLYKSLTSLTQSFFTISNEMGKQDEKSREKRAKRQFEINKAISIADATISTINGVVNALSEKSILPAPLSTIARAANAAAVAAAGLANIAKIKNQKFESASSVSPDTALDAGGAADSVSGTTPNINAIPAGSTLLNQPPQKVVVVESDITKTQKKVSVIESMATVG